MAVDGGCPGPFLSLDAMDEIATGLAAVDRVVDAGDGSEDAPRSLRLISTSSYDVWLITWPPGSGIEHHDHGCSCSVMRLVSGQLVEDDHGRIRLIAPGGSSVTAAHCSHGLWNARADEATSVHGYSPPLEEMTYRPDLVARALHPSGAGIRPRLESLAGRPAEASTNVAAAGSISDRGRPSAVPAGSPNCG